MKYFLLLLIFFLLANTILILLFLAEAVQARRYAPIHLRVEIQGPSINFLASLANFFELNRSSLLQIIVGLLLVINLFFNQKEGR